MYDDEGLGSRYTNVKPTSERWTTVQGWAVYIDFLRFILVVICFEGS